MNTKRKSVLKNGNQVTLATIGLSGFIGPDRLEAHRSCAEPKVCADYCVPGKPENFDQNRPSALNMGFELDNIFQSPEEMFKAVADKIDIVVINTTNASHASIATSAAEHGLHVICDKPLADTLVNADKMVDGCADVHTMVTPSYCGLGPNIEARHCLKDVPFEDIQGGRFYYPQGWMAKPIEEVSEHEGRKQFAWRKNPAESGKGGATGDIWTHLMHELWFMTGQRIVSVAAHRRWVVTKRSEDETDDQISSMVELEGGAIITADALQYAGGHQNDNEWEIWLRGGTTYAWDQGRDAEVLRFSDEGADWQLLTSANFTSPILGHTRSMPARHNGGSWKKAEQRLLRSFIKQVYGIGPDDMETFHPTFLDGRNIVACVDAAIKSSEKHDGGWVDVNWKEPCE